MKNCWMSGPSTGAATDEGAAIDVARGAAGTAAGCSVDGTAGDACFAAATASAINDLIWSRDSGPRRYDNAQRLWNVIGAPAWTSCSRNTRLPSDDRVLSAASRSRPPDAAPSS